MKYYYYGERPLLNYSCFFFLAKLNPIKPQPNNSIVTGEEIDAAKYLFLMNTMVFLFKVPYTNMLYIVDTFEKVY